MNQCQGISSVNIPGSKPRKNFKISFKPTKILFGCQIDGKTKEQLVKSIVRNFSNNYRKLHGLPMKRWVHLNKYAYLNIKELCTPIVIEGRNC